MIMKYERGILDFEDILSCVKIERHNSDEKYKVDWLPKMYFDER